MDMRSAVMPVNLARQEVIMDRNEREKLEDWCQALKAEAKSFEEMVLEAEDDLSDEDWNSRLAVGIAGFERIFNWIKRLRGDELLF
jgi:hypothetical protein